MTIERVEVIKSVQRRPVSASVPMRLGRGGS
jgi:hypothetical protein